MDAAIYLQSQSRRVNEALERYTEPATGMQPALLEAMRYSLLGGGKRLRPVLVLAVAEIFGAAPEHVMPTACALEMIHTYSLIHDDLPSMDDDDLRRGRPTNHKVYGEAMATLAGDALLTLAFEVLTRQAEEPGCPPTVALRVTRELAVAAGAAGMVGGQVEDLAWEGRPAGPAQLERIHRLKTMALFAAAVRCGGLLGGASPDEVAALEGFSSHFGLAFQIQDDVLDVIGDGAKTGKGVGRDLRHRKSTYVSLYGLDGAKERARAEWAAAQAELERFGSRAAALRALVEFVAAREG